LRRHFRDNSWAVHVARSTQERAISVGEAIEQLSARRGRSPTVQELAQYLELSQEEVLDGLQAGEAYLAKSLDAPLRVDGEDGGSTLGNEPGDDDAGYQLVEDGLVVSDLLGSLANRDRRLLRMRFVDEMTQSEIGDQLGVSQMQVSRLLRRTLDGLREINPEVLHT
jgi:RNA polymerase sigma-B factor